MKCLAIRNNITLSYSFHNYLLGEAGLTDRTNNVSLDNTNGRPCRATLAKPDSGKNKVWLFLLQAF